MGSRVEITVCHEFEVTLSASVSGGTKGRYSGPPEDCYPAEDPEVEDVRLGLSSSQVAAVKALLGRFFAGGKTGSEVVEALVTDILTELDPHFPGDNDDRFIEAADQEPDCDDRGDDE